NRLASLHGRPILARLFRQFTRGKGGARQTIASRLRADVKHRITDTPRRAASQLFVSQNSQAKNIYQWIALEAFIEINLAADGGNADAIAIVRNAGDHTGE